MRTCFLRSRGDGSGPPPDSPPLRVGLWSLVLLAAATSGCCGLLKNNACGPCGEVGPVRRLGQRIFNRSQPAYVDSYGPAIIGAPIAVDEPIFGTTVPGVISPEAFPPGVDLPVPADDTPLDLRPLDQSSTSSGNSSTSLNGGYQSRRPPLVTGSSPRDSVTRSSADLHVDPLRHLDDNLALRASPPTELHPVPAPTSGAGTGDPGIGGSGADPLVPGIARFHRLNDRLAAGSLPTDAGWSWLFEHEYRTALDLRPSSEVRQADVAALQAAGLRYIALPIAEDSVGDAASLGRFDSELALAGTSPIYFFDGDGATPAVMWYLRRVVEERTPPEVAASEADLIGPRDPALWARALTYVDSLAPPKVEPAPAPPVQDAPAIDVDPDSRPVPEVKVPEVAPASHPRAARAF